MPAKHRSLPWRFVWGFMALWAVSLPLLGARPVTVKADELVQFYPTAAFLDTNGQGDLVWQVPVFARLYEPEKRTFLVGLLGDLLGIDEKTMTPAEKTNYLQRARLFVVDNKSEKRLLVQAGSAQALLPPTSHVGESHGYLTIPMTQIAGIRSRCTNGPDWIAMEAANHTQGRGFAGKAFLVEPAGWTVISDIDDTIKITQVLDRHEALKNTFCRPFKAVPGMAPLYRRWANESHCAFFYVTGSPRQLFEPLSGFLASENFPAGIFHLRDFNLGNTTVLNLMRSPEKYKLTELHGILTQFPHRKYVMVGDSGEKDPEVYAALANQFPEAVQLILIRNVTEEKADSIRFTNTFQGLSTNRWRLFTDPSELQDIKLPPLQ